MYTVYEYGRMIADTVRMDAYHAALKSVVRPGGTVVDIGAGTGIFSLLACQFGAGHVYAIETSDAIHVAREIAGENGLADRISFLQEDSRKIDLPGGADVIVSDIRGALPLLGDNISTLVDARERLLKPGGAFIPMRDTLWCAATSSPEEYAYCSDPWRKYGFEMQAAARRAINTRSSIGFDAIDLVTDKVCWAEINYSNVSEANVASDVVMTAQRGGVAHGLVLWFDSELIDGIGYSNAMDLDPKERTEVYGQSFLPWPEPVALEAGDKMEVTLKANLVYGEYIWSWDTRILGEGDPGGIKAEFRQSTFFNNPAGIEQLRKKAVDFQPVLSASGEVLQAMLGLMDGSKSLQEISEALYARFPNEFVSEKEALSRVTRWSSRYAG